MTDLRKRACDLRDQLLDYAALIDDLVQYVPHSPAKAPPDHDNPRHATNGHPGIGKATEDAVIDFFDADHEPATTKEIFDAIHDRIPIGGINPLSTLSARLSMSKRIKRDGRGWMRG